MSREARGRCVPCGIIWTWPAGTRRIAGTRCPECGLQVTKTSQNVIGPRREYPRERRK